MKIAIVSDTHGNVPNFQKMVDWLNKQEIKVILHAGDIGDPASLKESLHKFRGDFFGVFGNMDKNYKILTDEYNKIPRVKIIENVYEGEFDGKHIAVTHFPDTAKKLAQSGKFDVVFYGHTHRPWDEKVNECHMINPGELAGQFYKPTFAVYDTTSGSFELKILEKI